MADKISAKGKNDFQGIKIERNGWNMEQWQTALDRCQITDARHIDAEENNNGGNNTNTGKRGGNDVGNFWHGPDDGHGQRYEAKHHGER